MIHFWHLPQKRNYVILNEGLRTYLFNRIKHKKFPTKVARRFKRVRISIKHIVEISKKLHIPLYIFEKNISWIGGANSKGVYNPKLPFNFNSRAGSRFIAAIVNDGSLTKENIDRNCYGRLMYDNFDETIRDSVIKDYITVFGGSPQNIAFREADNKKYLEFNSLARDVMGLIITKGCKSENNTEIPAFILKKKENMVGWIEQTIADEGTVKYYPKEHRRAIVWTRSIDISEMIEQKYAHNTSLKKLPLELQTKIKNKNFNLIESEKIMLDSLEIKYTIYNLEIYLTKKNKSRLRSQLSITKRKNLLALRDIIKIPSEYKDKKFDRICRGFKRYKEPLKVKNAILRLCKDNKMFNSRDLMKKMKYKNVSPTIKWLKKFEKEGIIKKIKKSRYGKGSYRKPAEYAINKKTYNIVLSGHPNDVANIF